MVRLLGLFEKIVPLQNIQPAVEVITETKPPIGVDLGLLSLIATSDGEKVEHPRFLRKAEKRLKHLQRVLSRKKKGSKNRFKARRRVASQHGHVSRQRLDFNHKLSARLLKEHGLIAFEDLKVRNMVRNPKLAKSILDAGWGQLMRLAEYKAIKAGSLVVRVPAAYSTQECSYCGTLNKVSLDVRAFECVGCHRLLDRDTNAAQVVLKRGLAAIASAGLTTTPTVAKKGRAGHARTQACGDQASTRPDDWARKPGRGGRNYMPRKGLEAHGLGCGRMSHNESAESALRVASRRLDSI